MVLHVFIENSSNIFCQIFTRMIYTFKESRQSFKWIEAADRNFKLLNKKIIENPILALPIFYNFFQVETDASGTTIGVVLIQE